MGINELLQAYRGLKTLERKDALVALASEMSAQDWRDMKSIMNTRSFNFDILANLPLELALKVFSHLDMGERYHLQRVCKPWRDMLGSASFVEQTLKDWYGPEWKDISKDLSNNGANTLDIRAEQIYRFCTARPYSSSHISLNRKHQSSEALLFQDILVTCDLRIVRLCNLRTGTYWTKHSPARERLLSKVFMSPEIVAFQTGAGICVSETSATGSQTCEIIRIPNQGIYSVVCRDRSVAYVRMHKWANPESFEIYVWDFDRRQGRSLQVNPVYNLPGEELCVTELSPIVLPNLACQTVTLFSLCCWQVNIDRTDTHNPKSIRYRRLAFNGELISTKDLFLPPLQGPWKIQGYQPYTRSGLFVLQVQAVEPDDHAKMSYIFDDTVGEFLNLPPSEKFTSYSSWMWSPAWNSSHKPTKCGKACTQSKKPVPVLANETFAIEWHRCSGNVEPIIHCFEEGLRIRADAIHQSPSPSPPDSPSYPPIHHQLVTPATAIVI